MAPDNGDDLARWHTSASWKEKADRARRGPVTSLSAKQRAVVRMVKTARDTVAAANGQTVERTLKAKEDRFAHPRDFEDYVNALVDSQGGVCAITGLTLQYDGDDDDSELLCSLDRIDSKGHYEPGNLQVLCKFVNRWKNDGDDATFRRLIWLVKSASADP
jgi:hypothetical protein